MLKDCLLSSHYIMVDLCDESDPVDSKQFLSYFKEPTLPRIKWYNHISLLFSIFLLFFLFNKYFVFFFIFFFKSKSSFQNSLKSTRCQREKGSKLHWPKQLDKKNTQQSVNRIVTRSTIVIYMHWSQFHRSIFNMELCKERKKIFDKDQQVCCQMFKFHHGQLVKEMILIISS